MSVDSVLATVENDAKGFLAKAASVFKQAKQIWALISSPQTRALLVKIGGDAIKLVKDADAAVLAAGVSVPLDAAVMTDIQTLIADAKAGDAVIVADLKVFGITL